MIYTLIIVLTIRYSYFIRTNNDNYIQDQSPETSPISVRSNIVATLYAQLYKAFMISECLVNILNCGHTTEWQLKSWRPSSFKCSWGNAFDESSDASNILADSADCEALFLFVIKFASHHSTIILHMLFIRGCDVSYSNTMEISSYFNHSLLINRKQAFDCFTELINIINSKSTRIVVADIEIVYW